MRDEERFNVENAFVGVTRFKFYEYSTTLCSWSRHNIWKIIFFHSLIHTFEKKTFVFLFGFKHNTIIFHQGDIVKRFISIQKTGQFKVITEPLNKNHINKINFRVNENSHY